MQKIIKKVTGRALLVVSFLALSFVFAVCFAVFSGSQNKQEQQAGAASDAEVDFKNNFGGSGIDYFYSITPTPDGFVAAGY